MTRRQFRFNPHSLTYELVSIPFKLRFYRLLRKVVIAFLLASLVNFVFSYFFYTPKVYRLNRRNFELLMKYELLKDKIRFSSDRLDAIKSRDVNVYRSIFAVDSVALEGLYAPYPEEKYEALRHNKYSYVMEDAWTSLDAFARRLYAQSVSLDTLQLLAKDKEKMTENIPAIWPVNKNQVRGHIGSFGYRRDPVYGRTAFHAGIDFAGKVGTAIYATGNGRVVFAGRSNGYGNNVVVDHGYGYHTRYAHMSKVEVVMGQTLKRGEKVGQMGNTGKSTGPHLHYEVIYKGRPVNPLSYFSRDMSEEDFKRIVEMARDITYETE